MNLFRIRVSGLINIPKYNVPGPVVMTESQDFITILKNSGFTVEILEEINNSNNTNTVKENKKEETIKEEEKVVKSKKQEETSKVTEEVTSKAKSTNTKKKK